MPRILLPVGLLTALGGSCWEEPRPPDPETARAEPAAPSEEARQAFARALAHFAAEEPAEAIREARRAVELAPVWAEARLALGKLLLTFSAVELSTGTFDRARIDEAVAELERAHELDPLDAEAAYWSGRALYKAARIPEAMRRLATALALKPRHGLALKELGLLHAAEGDVAHAKGYLTRAHELLPRDDEVLFQLGLQLEAEERLDEAKETYLRAAALNPAHPGPPTRLVWIHGRLGDEAGAQRASERLERSKEFGKRLSMALKHAKEWSRDPAAQMAVAELYREMGMTDSARSWARRTLLLDAEDPAARELLGKLDVAASEGRIAPEGEDARVESDPR